MAFENIGSDWLFDEVGNWVDHIEVETPVEFNEANRYLSIGSMPGYIDITGVTPFLVEIVNCFDINSPVRELNLMKGVQIGWSTVLECGILYFILKVKGAPIMYMTADNDLAKRRIDKNIIPMLEHSGFRHLIAPLGGGKRKTGETKEQLQFVGGATLTPLGAKNPAKQRDFSIWLFCKDEIDEWEDNKDGDPDKITDSRCDGYWDQRKIFRGTTPRIKSASKIYKQFRRGDERIYIFHCLSCGFDQTICEFDHKTGVSWYGKNKETGKRFGFVWDMDDGILVPDSVRYLCRNCGHEHFDHDKDRIFSLDNGAHWQPTSKPVDPDIRSYYLPAFHSPFKPWSARIADFIECWDVQTRKPIDFSKFQVFFNNVLAWPFEAHGEKIRFESVSAHRRIAYKKGEIPNSYAEKYAGGKILFLTCQVDVQKSDLAVAVMGWTRDARCFVIDYRRLRVDLEKGGIPCSQRDSSVWGELEEIIGEAVYLDEKGKEYKIELTLIDAGWGESHDAVITFCSEYEGGIVPILGRDRPDKSSKIEEFSTFTTKLGTQGYKIVVDYYKDRLAPVLRREWHEGGGVQSRYHFNAPVDITDKELKELTAETKKKKTDPKGIETTFWFRPSGRDNELWDLLVYGHAAVEMMAWDMCIRQLEKEDVVWDDFWSYFENRLNA